MSTPPGERAPGASVAADGTGGGHRLTRLEREARAHERHPFAVPCRLTFALRGMHDLRTVIARTRNVSRSGVLLAVERPLGDVPFLAVELAPGERALQCVVRRVNGLEIGAEFLEPLEASDLIALLHLANAAPKVPAR